MTIGKLQEHTRAIHEEVITLKASKAKYCEVINNRGTKQQAQDASNAITGGITRFWDNLCQAGYIVCLVVACPSAKDDEKRKENETGLRQLIMKLDAQLSSYLLDLFTSRKEIGKVGETSVICRFPIFLTQPVHNLASQLRNIKAGPHSFDAYCLPGGPGNRRLASRSWQAGTGNSRMEELAYTVFEIAEMNEASIFSEMLL